MTPRPVQHAQHSRGPAKASRRDVPARGPGLLRPFLPGLLALLTAAAVLGPAAPAAAQVNQLPMYARGADVEEHLGRLLPLDTRFTNSAGEEVSLGAYFGRGPNLPVPPRPTVISLVYYECPVACAAVMSKLSECFDKLDYTVGKDFNCLVFSFNDHEGTPLALAAKTRHLSEYNRQVDSQIRAGWEFHTGSETANRALADALGFKYVRLPDGNYSHPIATFILSPEGKIVRYIYGFDLPADQVKLALIEASEGRIAKSLGDKFAGFCFKWDGNTGRYTMNVIRVTQVAGSLTVLLLALAVTGFLVRERVRRRHAAPASLHDQARGSSPGTGAT